MNRVMRRGANSDLILSAFLLGLSIVTVSCGDFQDPAPGSSAGVTRISEAEFTNRTGIADSQPNPSEQHGQTVPNTTVSNLGKSLIVPPASTSPEMRTVTFSWDPSQDAHGYKVYLITASTLGQDIIDTGQTTVLKVSLRVGEWYGFTVSAYNTSGESPRASFVYFVVAPPGTFVPA